MARKSSQQILKELRADADGLKVRRIGIWTLEKLAIVNLYLAGFTNASSGAQGGVYIDGLAGPGLCEVRGARAPPKFVWGSPLLALRTRPTFQKCHMIEFNQSSFAVLKRRVSAYGDRGNPMPGDVNEILPSLLRNDVHPRAPCFCLLDPEGTELNWSTVKSAATTLGRRLMPELLILFPSAELLRLLPKADVVDPKHESILDRMLPSKRWRDIYAQRLSGSITPSDAKEQYVELYRDGLERLGYKAFSHIVAAPDLPGGTRRERYRLIFATQHPAGEAIMLDVFKRPYVLDYPVSAQLPMLD